MVSKSLLCYKNKLKISFRVMTSEPETAWIWML
jgi:hypothetical protein